LGYTVAMRRARCAPATRGPATFPSRTPFVWRL